MKILKATALCALSLSLLSCGSSTTAITDADVQKYLTGIWTLEVRDAAQVLTDDRVVVEYDYDSRLSFRSEAVDWKAEKEYEWEYFVDHKVEPEKTYEYVLHERDTESGDSHYYSSIGRVSSNDLIVMVTNADSIDSTAAKYLDEFHRTKTSYSDAIVGSWRGLSSENPSTETVYDHVWKFLMDGTFEFYTPDDNGDMRIDSSRTDCQYVAVGKWVAMRWTEKGAAVRECWDVEMDGENMDWTALRRYVTIPEGGDETLYYASISLQRAVE